MNKTTNLPGGIYDRRPSNVEGLVKSSIAGLYFENTGYISLSDSNVVRGENPIPETQWNKKM